MGTPLLQINNLTVSFEKENKSFTAVKNLSLRVCRGEIRALVGESGSGKSVTSMSILQLIPSPPVSYKNGSIVFYENSGEAINLLQASHATIEAIRGRKIAMIFQEPMTALNPVLTCGEQIIETIILHQQLSKEAAIVEAIALFKIQNGCFIWFFPFIILTVFNNTVHAFILSSLILFFLFCKAILMV